MTSARIRVYPAGMRLARRGCRQLLALAALTTVAGGCSAKPAQFDVRDPASPLRLVATIALPDVRGRIDHMALDAKSGHLFVAELGNGSVDDVDLKSRTVSGRISGLHEPQGVAWLPAQDEIAVASGDGTLRFYRASDRQEAARIALGDDADNLRVDRRNGNLVVGYGSGALGVVDPSAHRLVRSVKLPAHPEAFELLGSRVVVNVPDAHAIVLADIDTGQIVTTLGTGARFANYPMASDAGGSRVAVAFRLPRSVAILDAASGKTEASASICGDADDIYFRSSQLIVTCGSGGVELLDGPGLQRRVTVATQRGARTGLFDPATGRLYIAIPAGAEPAAIWVLAFDRPAHV